MFLWGIARLSQPFKCQPHKIVKHTETLFDHFVGLAKFPAFTNILREFGQEVQK